MTVMFASSHKEDDNDMKAIFHFESARVEMKLVILPMIAGLSS